MPPELWQNLTSYKTVLRGSEITDSLTKGRSVGHMWGSESVWGISDTARTDLVLD